MFKPSATLSDPSLDRDSWRAKGQAPGAPDRPNAVAQKRSVSRASSDSVRQTRSRTQGPLSQQGLSTRFTPQIRSEHGKMHQLLMMDPVEMVLTRVNGVSVASGITFWRLGISIW